MTTKRVRRFIENRVKLVEEIDRLENKGWYNWTKDENDFFDRRDVQLVLIDIDFEYFGRCQTFKIQNKQIGYDEFVRREFLSAVNSMQTHIKNTFAFITTRNDIASDVAFGITKELAHLIYFSIDHLRFDVEKCFANYRYDGFELSSIGNVNMHVFVNDVVHIIEEEHKRFKVMEVVILYTDRKFTELFPEHADKAYKVAYGLTKKVEDNIHDTKYGLKSNIDRYMKHDLEFLIDDSKKKEFADWVEKLVDKAFDTLNYGSEM